MMATPRLYNESAKSKARNRELALYSMDDEAIYGPVLYHLPFSAAIEQGLLSDYKILVLAISESYVNRAMQELLAGGGDELSLPDAARLVGCVQALRCHGDDPEQPEAAPLRTCVAFSASIADSRRIQSGFKSVSGALQSSADFLCEARHVDGRQSAAIRRERIDWLEAPPDASDGGPHVCRVLTNARCLGEGVDVPGLDAVLFMSPRRSMVEIVQAVGRVMRRAPGKEYGYVVLPIAIPAGKKPEDCLDDNRVYGMVWDVVRALRSHDDRLLNELSKAELNHNRPDRIRMQIIAGDENPPPQQLSFNLAPEQYESALYARLVEKCGDRRYWESWAGDIADIYNRLSERIAALIDNKQAARRAFDRYHAAMRGQIHPDLTEADAISMLAQHRITAPIFDALFAEEAPYAGRNYVFSKKNPVAVELNVALAEMNKSGLRQEVRDLERFYQSVEARVRGVDNDEGKQKILVELYEKFFQKAFAEEARRLGIAYTPIEIVDFVLRSADELALDHLGRRLAERNVRVLEPFAGTGSFLARLLQNRILIDDTVLVRKFRDEIYASERLLLAYYIASANIEMAYHGRAQSFYVRRQAARLSYENFPNLSLTDSFYGTRQQAPPIEVIIGNPPWGRGKKSENDTLGNIVYPALRARIAETYGAGSSATNRNALMDAYIQALRWASDRLGTEGMIAFVVNNSFLNHNSTDGVRQCLAKEFDWIHIVDLRGDIRKQRLSGDHSEGESVFGQSSQAGVALLFLVRSSLRTGDRQAKIRYCDIGDHLTREEKLATLREAGSVRGIGLNWRELVPSAQDDWLDHRDPAFAGLLPLPGGPKDGLFALVSNGVNTSRDAWALHFHRAAVAGNMRRMIDHYDEQLEAFQASRQKNGGKADARLIEQHIDTDKRKISWSSSLKNAFARGWKGSYEETCLRPCLYRPFVKNWLYFSRQWNERIYQLPKLFPVGDGSDNRVICVSGKGSRTGFSALVTDLMPNLHVLDSSVCFPRYIYPDGDGGERHDAIAAAKIEHIQAHYGDPGIDADAIFDYVYGVLHAPAWRNRFAVNLVKERPRIPLASDFHVFREAGRKLAALHLGYETGTEYPLSLQRAHTTLARSQEAFEKALADLPEEEKLVVKIRPDKTIRSRLYYNDALSLDGIPDQAWEYRLSGKTALGWVMDRYQVKTDKDSGIRSDPNDADAPDAILRLIRRVVYLSVETVKIVDSLPDPGTRTWGMP